MPETSHLTFHKSSYSGSTTQNCVEVAEHEGGAAVRDSQHPDAGHLEFPADGWAAFLRSAIR